MKVLSNSSLLACGFLLSAGASAATLSNMSVTAGRSLADSNVPGSEYDSRASSLTGALTYVLENDWFLTGVVAYSVTKVDVDADDSSTRADAQAGGLVASKTLAQGRAVTFSAIYGDVDMSMNPAVGANESADAHALTLGAGLAQTLPLSATRVLSLSANLAATDSDSENSVDAAGNPVGGGGRTMLKTSVGASHSWRLGEWSPNVRVGYALFNHESLPGSDDKHYMTWGAGLAKQLTSKDKLTFAYSSSLARNHYDDQNFSLTYSLGF